MPRRRAALLTASALLLAACSAAAADGALPDRGRRLLSQYQCGSCHAIAGVASARGQVATPLTAWKHRSYIAGRLPNRHDVLVRWIVAPASLVPGTAMPAMGVSPQDAEAMAAYLFSLE